MKTLKLEFLNKDSADFVFEILKKDINSYTEKDSSVELENNLITLQLNEKNNKLINLISFILYIEFSNDYKKNSLKNWLNETFFFIKKREIQEIINIVREKISITNPLSYETIKNTTFFKNIKTVVEDSTSINIRGLVLFRRKLFEQAFQNDILEPIVEKYMVEKEYEEFLKLLKYFVDISEDYYEEVNINFLDNNEKEIFDNNENNLLDEFFNMCSELIQNDDNVKTNDIIISALITRVPKVVKVFNINNLDKEDTEFLNTLKNLFKVETIS